MLGIIFGRLRAAPAKKQQGLKVELSRARGQHCAGLLTDLLKAYEYVRRDKLISVANATGFPVAILRMCLAAYSGPRRILVDGQRTQPFSIGSRSLIAGCSFATTLLKVYLIKVFDMLSRWHSGVELHVFVDDVGMNATQSTPDETAEQLGRATERLLTELDRLGLKVGIHKCMVLGSSKAVRDALARFMGGLARACEIPLQAWGKKLGVQYTMGSRRLAAIAKGRLAKAAKRSSRVSRLQRATSRRQRNQLYNTAVRPTATYGGAYWGFPDTSIRTLRSQVSMINGQPSRFRSTTMMCLIGAEGLVDPAYQAHILPIIKVDFVLLNFFL